jgi:hypothetical protein
VGLNTVGVDGEPLEIVASKSSHLWEALCRAYQVLGFDTAAGGDEVLRDLVLARIIEPTSKADSLRVLCETGIEPVDYRTVTQRLPIIAKPAVRQALSAACAARAGVAPSSAPRRSADQIKQRLTKHHAGHQQHGRILSNRPR